MSELTLSHVKLLISMALSWFSGGSLIARLRGIAGGMARSNGSQEKISILDFGYLILWPELEIVNCCQSQLTTRISGIENMRYHYVGCGCTRAQLWHIAANP
jgi:hypothetical protein